MSNVKSSGCRPAECIISMISRPRCSSLVLEHISSSVLCTAATHQSDSQSCLAKAAMHAKHGTCTRCGSKNNRGRASTNVTLIQTTAGLACPDSCMSSPLTLYAFHCPCNFNGSTRLARCNGRLPKLGFMENFLSIIFNSPLISTQLGGFISP